ncbi:MAG: DUF3179 domain-containing protein [Pyrinomonadaceae bacterium]
MKFAFFRRFIPVASMSLVSVACALSQVADDSRPNSERVPGWKTNTEKRSIELNELMSGGPPKDGIPAIDSPKFVSVSEAGKWLKSNEPVISLKVGNEARAYPLQILMWHEIVNDDINGQPVTVTFCPLCYTAITFDRRLDGRVLDFGVSGMLRHSDMVMYDRQTETWWQQISGEGLVGDLTDKVLNQIPSQIVSFGQFSKAFPDGKVMSRETGHSRAYGNNPYRGYDDITKTPFLYRGKPDERLKPMEKVIAIELDSITKAYPHTITRKKRVLYDRVGKTDIVIFHADGASSALDHEKISESKDAGSSGVFIPELDGQKLTFVYTDNEFVDEQTKSRWNVFGQATEGKLKGKQLKQIGHGDYFAFAWLVFKPKTEIFKEK